MMTGSRVEATSGVRPAPWTEDVGALVGADCAVGSVDIERTIDTRVVGKRLTVREPAGPLELDQLTVERDLARPRETGVSVRRVPAEPSSPFHA